MTNLLRQDEYEAFIGRIRRRRGAVSGCLIPRPIGGARNGADAASAHCGFCRLGKAWNEVTVPEASKLLEHLLCTDLAHGARIMGAHTARGFAKEFIGTVGSSSRYFTNGTWNECLKVRSDVSQSAFAAFAPITNSTFDAGLISVGDAAVAMLWVQDED